MGASAGKSPALMSKSETLKNKEKGLDKSPGL
nr:MAG TPA: hypothetical protein [Caudoviricetes sp.]